MSHSILVRRHQSRGDVLMVTPILRELRVSHPGSRITFATACTDAIGKNEDVDRIIRTEEIEGEFDLVVNLDGAYEEMPLIHPVQAYAKKAGLESVDNHLFYYSQKRIDYDHQYVVIHGGPTGWPGRDWCLDKFNIVSQYLRKQGLHVVNIGERRDSLKIDCDLDLVGNTNKDELAGWMDAAICFIGIDSYPAHLAQAMDCHSVVLFGTTLPQFRLTSPCAIGVTSDANCVGQHHREKPPITYSSCNGECMERISPKQVIESIMGFI